MSTPEEEQWEAAHEAADRKQQLKEAIDEIESFAPDQAETDGQTEI